MNEYLKGNYEVDVKIEEAAEAADTTDEFERKALARLGGSICFVSKKTLIWNGEPPPQARQADVKVDSERSEAADGAGTKDR